MLKYSWDFDRDAEVWWNDTHDTIEECLKMAMDEVKEIELECEEYGGCAYQQVYIGENVEFIPQVDCERLLDDIEEQASNECGEVGYDWCAYDPKKLDEIKELKEQLNQVVHKWMKEYGYYPTCYSVTDIKEYDLEEIERNKNE